MWQFLFWNKHTSKLVLAIDVGLASITAVLGERKDTGKCEMIRVFRFPFDFFVGSHKTEGIEKWGSHVFTFGLKKIMAEARKASGSVGTIMVSFSDPLSMLRVVSQRFERSYPNMEITEDEIVSLMQAMREGKEKNSVEGNGEPLEIAGVEITAMLVNGYAVKNSIGYRGKSLGIEGYLLLMSGSLKKYTEEMKETFFPYASLHFFSDSQILFHAIKEMSGVSYPVLVADVGGEMTSLFSIDDRGTFVQAETVPFGVRTLERMVASFLKIKREDAESLLKRHTAGTLDDQIEKRLIPAIHVTLTDWSLAVERSLSSLSLQTPATIVLTGGGADFLLFIDMFKTCVKKRYRIDYEPRLLKAESLQEFISPYGSLAGGGDAVLASLVLYG